MNVSRPRAERRTDALTKARIVQAAIETLDEGGVEMLTFRTLAARLSTGAGAIYHHVADKNDLLAAAASDVVAVVLAGDDDQPSEQDLTALMLRAFDAVSDRPWVGTQLAAAPWQPAVLQLLERVGEELDTLGVPPGDQFTAASVLVQHLIGVCSQFDAGSRLPPLENGRPTFLDTAVSEYVEAATPVGSPFLKRVTRELVHHDDREQYRAGVDIILAGIRTPRR